MQHKKNWKVVKFKWKIWNRKKNQILDFHFLSYGHFCSKNCQFSMNFHDNSGDRNSKSRKIVFSFVSAHCTSFMKVELKLRGGRRGGLHILDCNRARLIFTITQKIVFHSFQHIAHLSWKWDQNWGGEGVHILRSDRNKIFFEHTFQTNFHFI